MAIEDVLNRIAAGGWLKDIEGTKPEIPILPANAANHESLGSELAPVENLAVAKEWALQVLSDAAIPAFRNQFGGDFEPVAGKRYRLIREPDVPWADRCPQGHFVEDRLWLRQCVGIVCIECKAVYDPSECQIVLKPMDRKVREKADWKERVPGGLSRGDARKVPSPSDSPEKP
jgi:hypothetical protein